MSLDSVTSDGPEDKGTQHRKLLNGLLTIYLDFADIRMWMEWIKFSQNSRSFQCMCLVGLYFMQKPVNWQAEGRQPALSVNKSGVRL